MEKLTITVKEMAELLGVGRPMAYALVNRSDFPVIRLGRKIVIPIEKLKQWMDDHINEVIK